MSMYKGNKKIKKVASVAISASILMGSMSYSFADENNYKEEVIYIKVDENGKTDNIYVVNSFDTSLGSNIVDYGDYINVLNLSTKDKLNYKEGILESNINSEENKFYYQGEMDKNTEIPWDINIKYYLDGKKISAKELAGKSGKLELKLNIKQNEKVNKVFYDNYALQISMSLDGNKSENITVDGGSIASAGSQKAINFIKLPGEDASYTLSADVKDFEMSEISINGINMNLNVDVNIDDMTEPLNDLVDAVDKLNDGTNELNSGVNAYKTGVNELYKGTDELNKGVNQYKDGVNSLDSGVLNLQNVISTYKEGISTLNSSTQQLLKGMGTMNEGIGEFSHGLSYLNNGASDLSLGLENLSKGSNEYKQGIEQYTSSVESLVQVLKATLPQEQIEALQLDNLVLGGKSLASNYENINNGINSSLEGIKALSSGSNELLKSSKSLSEGSKELYGYMNELSFGTNELLSGINEINNGVSSLKSGSSQLVVGINDISSGTKTLSSGSSELLSGINEISTGVGSLTSGTNQLNDACIDMPDEIDSKVDELTSKYSSSDFETTSFVSEKNTNVESVQFAIRTDAIEVKEEKQDVVEEKVETNIWNLFLNLFKKDK